MRERAGLGWLALSWVSAFACHGNLPVADGGRPDSGSSDSGELDSSELDSGELDSGKLDAGAQDGSADAGPAFLTVLTSTEAFDGLMGAAGDVKYLATVEGAPLRPPLTEPCYFQNMSLFDYHLGFLRSLPGLSDLTSTEYAALVLRRRTRVWWGGGVKPFPATPHPSGRIGVIAWTVYHESAGADRLNSEDLRAVFARLSGCLLLAPEKLAFLPIDPFQVSMARLERESLLAVGVAVVLPEELR